MALRTPNMERLASLARAVCRPPRPGLVRCPGGFVFVTDDGFRYRQGSPRVEGTLVVFGARARCRLLRPSLELRAVEGGRDETQVAQADTGGFNQVVDRHRGLDGIDQDLVGLGEEISPI